MTGFRRPEPTSSQGRCDDLRSVGDAMSCMTSLPVVDLTLDGPTMLAAFEPDASEHARRSDRGASAVTSTALLHGIWLLPSGVPVPIEEIPEHKRSRLANATSFVEVAGECFTRLYSPPGVVRAVAFSGRALSRSLQRAARFTPIVQRFVVSEGPMRLSADAVETARRCGVGLIEHASDSARVLLPPGPAELGVPAVYRWWIAELAYESWLYESAQPVS